MEGDTVSFCPFNQALIVINVRSWVCDSLQLLFRDCRETCVHGCVFRGGGESERETEKERKCEYVHDKGMYKGSWHRIPGAQG